MQEASIDNSRLVGKRLCILPFKRIGISFNKIGKYVDLDLLGCLLVRRSNTLHGLSPLVNGTVDTDVRWCSVLSVDTNSMSCCSLQPLHHIPRPFSRFRLINIDHLRSRNTRFLRDLDYFLFLFLQKFLVFNPFRDQLKWSGYEWTSEELRVLLNVGNAQVEICWKSETRRLIYTKTWLWTQGFCCTFDLIWNVRMQDTRMRIQPA